MYVCKRVHLHVCHVCACICMCANACICMYTYVYWAHIQTREQCQVSFLRYYLPYCFVRQNLSLSWTMPSKPDLLPETLRDPLFTPPPTPVLEVCDTRPSWFCLFACFCFCLFVVLHRFQEINLNPHGCTENTLPPETLPKSAFLWPNLCLISG